MTQPQTMDINDVLAQKHQIIGELYCQQLTILKAYNELLEKNKVTTGKESVGLKEKQ